MEQLSGNGMTGGDLGRFPGNADLSCFLQQGDKGGAITGGYLLEGQRLSPSLENGIPAGFPVPNAQEDVISVDSAQRQGSAVQDLSRHPAFISFQTEQISLGN